MERVAKEWVLVEILVMVGSLMVLPEEEFALDWAAKELVLVEILVMVGPLMVLQE